jgi:hypothetical protein
MNYSNYTPQYIDYHKIIDFMRSVQLASPRLQSFGHGDIVYFSQTLTGGTATYPYMFVTPMNVSYAENTTQYQLNVIFGDIVNTDLSNEIDVVSDMSLEARNLLSQIWRGSLFNDIADVQLPTNAVPFLERFNDHVGGVSLDLVITVMEDMNACPMYDLPVPTETPICETPTPTPDPTPTSTTTSTPTPTTTPTTTPTPDPTPTSTTTPTPTTTPGPSFDVDAAAYLDAVILTGGTLDATISAATNTLFTELKNEGIYNELLAFYPSIGATSGSTSLNGIRTNSQFDIVWTLPQNMIFNYSGASGNGSNTGGNTNILVNTDLTLGNRHMCFYSTGDRGLAPSGYEIGGGNGINNVLIVSYNGTTGYYSFNGYKTYSNTSPTGFYYTQISGNTSMIGYKNGVEVINTTSTDIGASVYTGVLSDNRIGTPSFQVTESSDKTMAWASFGNDLTLSQITAYENIINTFQTTLGRNTY